MNQTKRLRCCAMVLVLGWGFMQPALAEEAPSTAVSAEAPEKPSPEQIFARVNGKPVTQREFDARFYNIIRQRFYHGLPPGDQADAVRKEVSDLLIDFELLVEEAEKRGIKPEEEKIEKVVASAEARFGTNPEWQKQREEMIPKIKAQVARQSLYDQIEKQIKGVPKPTTTEARAFYDKNLDLFTEPVKLNMSIIVQRVDPSAPKEDWTRAREEIQKLIARIKEGADFSELARQYSTDKSASNGGNLGYVHTGMLNDYLQTRIDSFRVGEMTEPTTILEGVGVYRLDERVPSKLREFADVEQRAMDLLERENIEQAWKKTIDSLRAAAKIEILAPIADSSNTNEAQTSTSKPEGNTKQGNASGQEGSGKEAGAAK
ncbi:MAG: peptidylprolyl isomerase [Gallionellaceae bacterium]|nr:peptidylprolyl isomerase [Gallionellaceae bacterium]